MSEASQDQKPRHGYEISLNVAELAIKSQDEKKHHGHDPTRPKLLSVSKQILQDLEEIDGSGNRKRAICSKCFCCTDDPPAYWNTDVVARWLRFGLIAGIPITMLFIMNAVTDGGRGTETFYLSRILGIGIALMFTFYFLSLLYQLGNRRTLYYISGGRFFQDYHEGKGGFFFKIETRLSNVDKWALMRIANSQVMYKLRAIQSISEFSAISGGQANQMIANLGPFTWVSVVMMYIAHMQCDDGYAFHLDFTDVLLVIGVNGIVMIGLFELNQFDLGMKDGHYVGVGMAMCILVAALAQGWSLSADYGYFPFVVSIVLTVMGVSCFLYWMGKLSTPENARKYEDQFNKEVKERAKKLQAESREKSDEQGDAGKEEKTENEQGVVGKEEKIDPKYEEMAKKQLQEEGYIEKEELREKVSRLSVQCVACEGFAIYCTTLALCWYLYHWGKTCKIGCIHD